MKLPQLTLSPMKLSQKKQGWIGVDIGTSTVKIAQVERYKQGWRVAASVVVPRQQSWQTELLEGTEAVSSLDELQAGRSLQQGYRGRRVAAALPMSLCDVHRLDRDLSQEANAPQILRHAIETATQQSAKHLQCDFWSAPAAGSQPAWTQALAVSRNWADQLCEDIAQAGWSCEAIDGLPQAMTRAVKMVHSNANASPVAALDWGSSRATLCFLENGQPSYVRCLKECGLGRMLEALVDNLRVNELEAQRLLEEYAIATPRQDGSADIAKLVQEVLAEPMNQLAEELRRSFSHFQYVRRMPAPETLYLFGGGAMIENLDNHLSSALSTDSHRLEARTWQLPGPSSSSSPRKDDARDDCLFAAAIALSAIAWEAS